MIWSKESWRWWFEKLSRGCFKIKTAGFSKGEVVRKAAAADDDDDVIDDDDDVDDVDDDDDDDGDDDGD